MPYFKDELSPDLKFVPELDQQPSDIVVTKKSWGAFPTTDIEKQLRGWGDAFNQLKASVPSWD